MIAALDRLARAPEEAARLAAPLVEAELRATAAAGTDPDGHPWPQRKAGGRAMAGAASHITCVARGPVVRATLNGPDVFHHFGARGEPRRQVLTDPGAIPAGVAKALDRAAAQAFARAVG